MPDPACAQPLEVATPRCWQDFNVVPTDMDIYNPRSWLKDALLQPESRACYQRLLDQGWVDAIRHLYPDERVYTFWDYFRNHWAAMPGCESITCCSIPSLRLI
jgi:exonuclease III